VLYKRTIGKGVFSYSGIGRTADMSVTKVEKALKMVAVGIFHHAVADGTFQLL